MASHADVAQRFAQYLTVPPDVFPKSQRNLRGSRMAATFCRMWTTTNNFVHFAYGESYDTIIARIVLNTHTQAPELWLSERRYSQSTDRHRAMYRAAYVRHCSSLNILPRVYMFTSPHTNRNDPSRLVVASNQVASGMYSAARRGAHTATRELVLTNTRASIDVALRHMTEGISDEHIEPHAESIAMLQAQRRTIETMLASPETIKAAALGWLALNDIAPPTN